MPSVAVLLLLARIALIADEVCAASLSGVKYAGKFDNAVCPLP